MAFKCLASAIVLSSFFCSVESFFGSGVIRAVGTSSKSITSGFSGVFKAQQQLNTPRTPLTVSVATMDEVETGPMLSAEKRALVENFVKSMGGKRSLQRVLIANNGMAATKAILSMRQWAYMTLGDERAIEFVAMATRDDLNANAEFIRLADAYVEVPSGSNKNNYANVDLIVEIAENQKVDAVWPGWGHASENPRLPSTLKEKGIQFIGPTAPVMAALGDKVSANILAQTAEVPSIPWSGGGIKALLNDEGVIPKDVFDSACVFDVEGAVATAEKIGYPVMIKASEGGGGKGIRMANNIEELRTGFVQVQNEVVGSPIFMMQLMTNARHLEVQIVGDEYGNAVALNGRDCSTQRRFQKIFEEGPPIVAPRDVFRQMELSAQRLTQSIGYIGAGTVEYLYNAASNKYYFLELNPRLQVEHPVTEGLTGVNLPSVQLQVAMGIPLNRIPEIRQLYGLNPNEDSEIKFLEDEYKYPDRHVIAARITAENPDEGFKPTSGRIERVKFQSTPRVWGYFSVGANGGIHEFADSQFGHLFASGPTREDARKALVLALKEIDVRGDIRTTVEYLIKLLETPEFKDNTIDTSWLDGIIREKTVSVSVEPHAVALSAAIFRAHSIVNKLTKELTDALAKGQPSLQGISSLLAFPIEITYDSVKYSFLAKTLGPNIYSLNINDQEVVARVREQPDNSLLCSVGKDNYQLFGQDEALGLRMKINGATVMIPTIYNPSELRSDVTGKIVRFLHQDGETVEKGKPYVEVEAMKMILSIKAGESGIISHNLSPGSIISAGDLIANLQLKDLSRVKQIAAFRGTLSVVPLAPAPITQPEEALEEISLALDGYEHEVKPQVYLETATLEDTLNFFTSSLNKFLTAEQPFQKQEESEAVSTLTKANKEDLVKIVPYLIAHKQIKSRALVILALLRQLEFLPNRFRTYTADQMPSELRAALAGLADLTGTLYGELSLKSKQLIDDSLVPPFETRLNLLKTAIMTPEVDLKTLSKQPDISVSVDLLVVLLADSDIAVRKAALEVYLRRVYRAHCIKSLNIIDVDGSISAEWAFTMRDTADVPSTLRYGYFTMFPDFAAIKTELPEIIKKANVFLNRGTTLKPADAMNVLHIGFSTHCNNEDTSSALAKKTLDDYQFELKRMNLRAVNFLLVNPGKKVSYLNFLGESGFNEDLISRNLRPTMPQLLELNRLTIHHDLERLATVGRNSQLYLGREKGAGAASKGPKRGDAPQVLFLRSISLSPGAASPAGSENMLVQAMDELERATLDPRVSDTASSRVYLNILPEVDIGAKDTVTQFKQTMDTLISKYATRLLKLNVDELEVKVRVNNSDEGKPEQFVPVRLIASSSTGGWLTREAYREYLDPITGQTEQYCTLTSENPVCVLDPYPTSNILQTKRAVARRVGSTYAPDFLGLMEVALINAWQSHFERAGKLQGAVPPLLFTYDELVIGKDGELRKEKRFPGTNKVGMLAWHTVLKTPQYPEGREVIMIANDVTVQSGSFGVIEDEFFFKASVYARERGIPRVFISCNSGARIGLVDELKSKFQVAWKDESNPALGFDYLYLSEDDYHSLAKGTVDAVAVTDKRTGETRWQIEAIIGQTNGIGVENLRGSGLIAGETSRAYDETFTLSYVTGRSVGIGAYLNRLGQRVIQMQQGPMILTGYSALNKLLGKEVYTSQDQLGGPQVMYPNGVTHEVVQNDKEGMQAVVDWLNYTPKDFSSVSPALENKADPPSRRVEFTPSKTPYDPRHMLGGVVGSDGTYVSGFFDKGTFKEYLGGWGKSVVTGRARLGGINVGVIAVETRLVEQRIPADPGNPESRETIQPQAGQVWYPDSAYKTAQAIQDFNRGENLPLIIFANWRGFSGGTRDMYGEILKFGAMIVDSLRTYKHPVFVYIPPGGELRGGAWVVIDPTINPQKMEMYADKNSRGGILEPPGICEVKYRFQEQKIAMHRLDNTLIELDDLMNTDSGGIFTRPKGMDTDSVLSDIKSREKNLAPLYTQIAHEFADLHDRAGRMKAKGCISEVLEWPTAREYFYWRIRRRQAEDPLKDRLVAVSNGHLDLEQAALRVTAFVPASESSDRDCVAWMEGNSEGIEQLVQQTRREFAASAVQNLLKDLTPADFAAVMAEINKK